MGKKIEYLFAQCGKEMGRENESFPVAEALKPLGFRERSDSTMGEEVKNNL